MSEASCFVCGTVIDIQKDEWWSHSWEEQPAEDTIDKAIESDDFRDWFRENKILCPECHKDLIARILTRREINGLGNDGLALVADVGGGTDE